MSLLLPPGGVPSSLTLAPLEIFLLTAKAAFLAMINDKKYTNREVQGLKTKLSLKKVAEHYSFAKRVIISCKCKGLCQTKRYKCFKEGENALFTVMI
jgi:hypothetical protein